MICKSLPIKSDLTATVMMCRKVVKLMLTCLTKQSPSCQDVDAAPKSDPVTFPPYRKRQMAFQCQFKSVCIRKITYQWAIEQNTL